MSKYIIGLDQGTTSSRAIIFDQDQNIVEVAQKPFRQIYPKPSYVEHDPIEIYTSQYTVMIEALAKSGIPLSEVAAIGITNQRETTIVWDKNTGKPVYNAIVWQCRRTAGICEDLKAKGLTAVIKEKTGLIIDAYFSATKIKWILDNVEGAREKAENGDLLFGTVDSYLVWQLTAGKVHITDYTNASRTMLFNINTLQWDEELCKELTIPMCMLPTVKSSSEIYGTANINGTEIPIASVVGDQQAALFGQTCFNKGECKNTYGTGCFLLMNVGNQVPHVDNGLLTTIAATVNGEIQYALEGSVFVGGAVIQWLRDEMHLIHDAKDTAKIATSVSDNGGVYIVPAFTGLGAPYWNMYCRGTIFGLTRGSKPAHIIRAAEEAIAYQSADLLNSICKSTGIEIQELNVDGGACRDEFLMQFQSDILNIPVRRPIIRETTALGCAYLAGLATGVWKDTNEIKALWSVDKVFTPKMKPSDRERYLKYWKKSVESCMTWNFEER
ncbi:glycerol kinase GlpK [Paludicola sp. MB14-C6]|uniref:glycerol kinase GlpK n=1 Tax=Paludihabitans sp. MB14-C6 TaxID=3070656 RepID=UPI0027DB4F45|nr:glycerol kinase GlpK [Paludicola sp. MB14-C6]WMJ23778.1 glycerol kinase GlpK [Paludicola sp. MB14-C6]